jgi:hypothetical protein
MRKMLLAAALLALLLAACEAQIRVGLQINEDGSGTVAFETGFDDEFAELVFQGQDPESLVFEDLSLVEFPEAETGRFTEGDFTFYTVTVPFDDANELNEIAANEDSPFENLSVSASADEVRVEGIIGTGEDAFIDPNALEGGDFDTGALEDVFSFSVRILLPGEVTEENADRTLSDGTLEWDLPLSGESVSILAVSDPSGGGSSFPWWVLAVVAVVGLLVVVVFILSRRSGSTPPEDDADQPAEAATDDVDAAAATSTAVDEAQAKTQAVAAAADAAAKAEAAAAAATQAAAAAEAAAQAAAELDGGADTGAVAEAATDHGDDEPAGDDSVESDGDADAPEADEPDDETDGEGAAADEPAGEDTPDDEEE